MQLWVDVAWLRYKKNFKDIERAIKAYLAHRPKAESWMYSLLAEVIKINRGEAAASEIKSCLGWAGYLARKEGSWQALGRVADLLMVENIDEIALALKGENVRIGPDELLDLAIEKAPERPEPIVLSMHLATKQHDPQRMARAVDQFLSIGWPGYDEVWRNEALKEARNLAKTLREDGRSGEADTLENGLVASAARDLFIRLSWTGDAGVELVVDEPLGATASFRNNRTVFGGAIVRMGYGKGRNAEGEYVCPRAFDGDYKVRVDVIYNDAKKPVTTATLEIVTHEGTAKEKKEFKTISLLKPEAVIVHLEGGRRKTVLPFQASSPTEALGDPGLTIRPPDDTPEAAGGKTKPADSAKPGQSKSGKRRAAQRN
jgi:hypothetical protein